MKCNRRSAIHLLDVMLRDSGVSYERLSVIWTPDSPVGFVRSSVHHIYCFVYAQNLSWRSRPTIKLNTRSNALSSSVRLSPWFPHPCFPFMQFTCFHHVATEHFLTICVLHLIPPCWLRWLRWLHLHVRRFDLPTSGEYHIPEQCASQLLQRLGRSVEAFTESINRRGPENSFSDLVGGPRSSRP